ncbi:MAG0490 family ComEA-like DNA-binding protein [Mycoplasmopsis gallinarum]|uniref:MAG0490 family ComEA-like DNA-binding protein n=1 Tax=Mycoplasmopsis gallinarum TaxID=29557 RepID=UPI00048A124A|nr:hypothetical protein [Mycoplasmopsis gallinarum]
MRKKKYFWLFVGLFSLFIIGSSIAFNTKQTTVIKKEEGIKPFTVKIYGAVKNPIDLSFNRSIKLKELISLSKPLLESDLSTINLNSTINKNFKLEIPYKQTKISINKIKSLKDWQNLKISKTSALKLFNLHKQNKIKSWKDIESISSLSSKTLKILKSQIII